jgi:hypothetical protein
MKCEPARNHRWELYELSNDWTQHEDAAARYSARLKELQDLLFWNEAESYQVLRLILRWSGEP